MRVKNDPITGWDFFSTNGKLIMLGDGKEEMSTIPVFSQIQLEGICRFIDRA